MHTQHNGQLPVREYSQCCNVHFSSYMTECIFYQFVVLPVHTCRLKFPAIFIVLISSEMTVLGKQHTSQVHTWAPTLTKLLLIRHQNGMKVHVHA